MAFLGTALLASPAGFAEENLHAGLLFDQFPLTLDAGKRTEAIGPFFYNQKKDSEKTWAVPPIFSHDTDPAVESREDDFIYPFLTYDRYGKEYRWQLFQLFSFAGGQDANDADKRHFTLFPFYFQQRSADPSQNYTAVVPFYGHLRNRLFRDEIYFVMFPIFGESRKRDVVTDNYLYPIFHLRHGDGLHDWQVWPLLGKEHKDVTTQTNGFGEVATLGGHDKFFALWFLYLRQNTGIGTDNPEKFCASIPFFAATRSPRLDSTTVLFPFFTWIDNREKKYREWQGPYPFVVFARGEKTTSRVWPLFSRSKNQIIENDSYLWPLFRHKELHADPLEQARNSVLFYVYVNVKEKNTQTGAEKKRLDMWPFFIWHRDFGGNERLQILAPLEPILSGNRGIERNWSPLWSLWRSENSAKTGAMSQSLLWNLYRLDRAPGQKKCSLLFGLFQYQSDGKNKRLRLFYIPVMKTHQPTGQSTK